MTLTTVRMIIMGMPIVTIAILMAITAIRITGLMTTTATPTATIAIPTATTATATATRGTDRYPISPIENSEVNINGYETNKYR